MIFLNECLVSFRTVLFTLTSVVVLVITTDWISWDKLNRGFLPSDEVSRAFLASFILVFDLLIVMQVSVYVSLISQKLYVALFLLKCYKVNGSFKTTKVQFTVAINNVLSDYAFSKFTRRTTKWVFLKRAEKIYYMHTVSELLETTYHGVFWPRMREIKQNKREWKVAEMNMMECRH